MTIDELFRHLAEHMDTEAAAGLNKTIQWNITDAEPGQWVLEIVNGKGSLTQGSVDKPDTTFTTASDTWVAIAEGREDPMRAFLTGKMKVSGDMMLALKAPKLFPTTTPT